MTDSYLTPQLFWLQVASPDITLQQTNNFSDSVGNTVHGQVKSVVLGKGNPDPVVSSSLTMNSPDGNVGTTGLDGSANIGGRYYFRVLGPSGTVSINVAGSISIDVAAIQAGTFTGKDDFMTTLGDYAIGDNGLPLTLLHHQAAVDILPAPDFGPDLTNFLVGRTDDGLSQSLPSSSFDEGAHLSLSYDDTISVISGEVYYVDVFSNASASYSGAGQVQASVVVDPLLSIDPGTPNADLYSFEFSSGLGSKAAAAPEVGSTAAMLGLAMVGLAGLRKRSYTILASISSAAIGRLG